MRDLITDVGGLKVGHFTDNEALTGVTVVITPQGAVGGVDVRGSAPGTRETDLLRPMNLVDRLHGIALAGGSAYGLDAASGVMRYLEENGVGFDTGPAKVPIVPAAVIFDLAVGDPKTRPNAEMGYMACESAAVGDFELGNAGAGTGATVGKAMGPKFCMKGGVGSASVRIGDNVIVGALFVVNAFGDVLDMKTRRILAGAYDPVSGKFFKAAEVLKNVGGIGFPGANTTIGVVATNAFLTKETANKLAQVAHNGLAITISPVHTMLDGDTIFAISTGNEKADINSVSTAAVEAVARSVNKAVLNAVKVAGIPAVSDIG
jgi:L-aminopeptidase/D-esterase-like protein